MTMKKITAVLLALLLTFSCAASLADLTPAQVIGKWYSTGVRTVYGQEYQMTGEYSLEFKRDYTATLSFNGTEKTCTWKVSGDSISLRENDVYYTALDFADEALYFDEKDFSLEDTACSKLVFTREESPELPVLPEIIPAEKEDDFFGEWQIVFSVLPFGVINASEEDASLKFKVEFAQITMTSGENTLYALTNYTEDGKLVFDAHELNIGYGNMIVELATDGYARITKEDTPAEAYNYYLLNAEFIPEEAVEETTEAAAPAAQ